MKRFHVHLSVTDLERNVEFYTRLFGAAPDVVKPDYAKWMLEDPRVNFAMATGRATTGVEHLGLQVDSAAELDGLRHALRAAAAHSREEAGAHCCYAQSDKHWATDPQGVAWEGFHTLGEVRHYGSGDHAGAGRQPATPMSSPRCCAD